MPILAFPWWALAVAEDAAGDTFPLATPIAGAAAVLKLPDLLGPAGADGRGQALVAALGAAAAAYLAVT